MRLLETTVEQGLEAPVTVIGATRFLPVERWPRGRAAQEELMRAELDVALDDLNDYIIALGLVTNDARRRPVAAGDLPFLCPVVLEGVPMAEGQRVGTNFIYPIHDVTQGPHAMPEVSDEQFKHAALLSRDAFTKAMPFWPFYEFMFRCHSDGLARDRNRGTFRDDRPGGWADDRRGRVEDTCGARLPLALSRRASLQPLLSHPG
jgi:hypothetical protein